MVKSVFQNYQFLWIFRKNEDQMLYWMHFGKYSIFSNIHALKKYHTMIHQRQQFRINLFATKPKELSKLAPSQHQGFVSKLVFSIYLRLQICRSLKCQQGFHRLSRIDNFGLPAFFGTRHTTTLKVLANWRAPCGFSFHLHFETEYIGCSEVWIY